MNIIYVVTILEGLLFLLLGYFIRYKQMVEIIAGYDPKKVVDREGLAKWVGSNLILLGITAFFAFGAEFALSSAGVKIFMGYHLLIVLGICVRTALGCKKYERT